MFWNGNIILPNTPACCPDIKSGLGVLGSGGAKPQEILGLDITTKKKKKAKKITRKQIRVDDRKKKSIRGNAKNNIKSGYKRKPKGLRESKIAPYNMPNNGHYPGVK